MGQCTSAARVEQLEPQQYVAPTRPQRRPRSESFVEGAPLSRTIAVSNEELLGKFEIPAVDEERFATAASVWEALSSGHVKPFRMSWILQHASGSPKLAASREFPDDAFATLEELQTLFGDGNDQGNGAVLPLIAVCARSLCELPDARQLEAVVATLRANREHYEAIGYTEMGVIWPWASFRQNRGPGRAISAEERAGFDAALSSMDLWFFHRGISAILLDDPPARSLPGFRSSVEADHTSPIVCADGRPSGWAAFARLAAEQQQKWLAWNARWNLVCDLATPAPAAPEEAPPEGVPPTPPPLPPRHWPVGPEDFEQLAPVLAFPSAEEAALAVRLFQKASTSTLGTVTFLNRFDGLHTPSIHDAHRLGVCCNCMNRLVVLDFLVRVATCGARAPPILTSPPCPHPNARAHGQLHAASPPRARVRAGPHQPTRPWIALPSFRGVSVRAGGRSRRCDGDGHVRPAETRGAA